jgi:hypothetical protein
VDFFNCKYVHRHSDNLQYTFYLDHAFLERLPWIQIACASMMHFDVPTIDAFHDGTFSRFGLPSLAPVLDDLKLAL